MTSDSERVRAMRERRGPRPSAPVTRCSASTCGCDDFTGQDTREYVILSALARFLPALASDTGCQARAARLSRPDEADYGGSRIINLRVRDTDA